jgi:hypothetical protein
MPSPKSGKAPSAETPKDPKAPSAPVEAKGGSKSAVPKADPPPAHKPPAHKPPAPKPPAPKGGGGSGGGGAGGGGQPKELSWIEIELKDEDGKPVAGEAYRVTLPDGSVAEGSTDDKGLARIEGFEPGACDVAFPRLDKDEWKKG